MKTNCSKPISLALLAFALGGAYAWPANAEIDAIGSVVQRNYRGATGEHKEMSRHPLYFANAVHADEKVQTGQNGATRLELLDHTEVAVGENATIILDSFAYDPKSKTSSGLLQFGEGAFRYVGGESKHKEGLRLKTPVATIAIRGTELVIFVAPSGRTEVNVIEGAISVAGCAGGSADLGAGERATIDPDCNVAVDEVRKLPPHFVPKMPSDFALAEAQESNSKTENDNNKDRRTPHERVSAPNNGKGKSSSGGKNTKGGSTGGPASGTGGGPTGGGSTGGSSGGAGGGATGGGSTGGGSTGGGSTGSNGGGIIG